MTSYFDWAATSKPKKSILEKAHRLALEYFGNPSSLHLFGSKSKQLLEEARNRCARILEVSPKHLYFTSGGSESNQIPFFSLLHRPRFGSIAISTIEHPSITNQVKSLEKLGWKILNIPVDKNGIVSTDAVLKTIQDDTALVAVMAVNNETGAIQPVYHIAKALDEIGKIKKKPYFHVDAVQAIGKIPFKIHQQGFDFLSISAHKIQGPKGIGLLYTPLPIESFLKGGGQENGIRPGTENLYGAIALSFALEQSIQNIQLEQAQTQMEKIIIQLTDTNQIFILPETRKPIDNLFSPWILQCTNLKFPAEVLVRSLSDKGVFISTGSACSSKNKKRTVLEAMQVPYTKQQNAFRISIGLETSDSEIDHLITAIKKILVPNTEVGNTE